MNPLDRRAATCDHDRRLARPRVARLSLVRPGPVLRAALVACALGAAPAASAQVTDPGPDLRPPVAGFAKGRVLVQPRAGLPERDLDRVLAPHAARRVRLIRQIRVHVLELPPQANALAVARALRMHPHVEFAELDLAIAPALVPNDPYYGQAWHLPKIGAPQAWDASTGAGVTIAILDTGVNAAHPDLAARMVSGWNVYDNTPDTSDVYGHGTKVAGAAAAAGNNGLGVAGVGFAARIMPIRISDPSGYAYFSDMAEGVIRAADFGARVANISYQGAAGSASVDNAAQYMRSKGGVVVVSAGNTGAEQAINASPNVTVASATDSADQRPSWSSFGGYVDIAAPGVSVLTTTSSGGYGGFSGTSASSPVVAGTYALMMAANPALQPADLDAALFASAMDLGAAGKDAYYGAGRVDAAGAVSAARQAVARDTTPPAVSITNPPAGSKVSGVVPVDVVASDNVAVARVELLVDGSVVATDAVAPYAFAWDSAAAADGEATLSARAVDAAGNAALSAAVKVTVGNDTTAPLVQIVNPPNGARVTGTVTVSVSASDDNKVAKITLVIDGKDVATSYGASLSYAWNTGGGKGKGAGKGRNASSGGTSTLTARATDPAGNIGTATATVTRY